MKKVIAIVVCLVFVFGAMGVSFAQEKAAAKPAAKKAVVIEEVGEDVVAKDKAGNTVIKEVVAEDVKVLDKAGKPEAEEIIVEEAVKPIPVTTAATTSAGDIK